jgi:predicted aspartyl protease
LIEGSVTENGVPAIEVQIGDQRWRAIIDMGFNGELELPENYDSM